MQLQYVTTKTEIKNFIRFGNSVYEGNPYYRDSMSDIVKMFLYRRTAFLKHAEIYPFVVKDGGKTVLRACYIIDYTQKNILTISFFEALEDARGAVDLMLDRTAALARSKGRQRIVIGMDAHLNYGLGFLASHFDADPCFGFGYTPEYYLKFFAGLKEYRFTSFLADVDKFNLDKEQAILGRIKSNGYTFRLADFNYLDREIQIYTDLNNFCFQDHLWWADRTFEEDRELLYPFRWFLKGENLIIAEKGGEPVGFMLWYPDYNQLIAPGKGIGLTTLVKSKFAGRRIDKFKIAEMGIRPEYQGTGVALGLFEQLHRCVQNRYKYCEAGWVEENNNKSRGFGLRWRLMGCQEYKQYKVFEVIL